MSGVRFWAVNHGDRMIYARGLLSSPLTSMARRISHNLLLDGLHRQSLFAFGETVAGFNPICDGIGFSVNAGWKVARFGVAAHPNLHILSKIKAQSWNTPGQSAKGTNVGGPDLIRNSLQGGQASCY
uniref:TonB_dep_Rec domain-containing protein n=1 Tax=Steinernema glaseri TaxID=37863 RepID=A0A1I7ZMA8_9BILA